MKLLTRETRYSKCSKYKYRLHQPILVEIEIYGYEIDLPFFKLQPDGLLILRKGYCWNGSNYSIDYKSRTASAVHDAGYQLMREGCIEKSHRKYIDQVYKEILIIKGLWVWHANFRYNMLRKLGGTSAKLAGKPDNRICEE